MNGAVSIEEFAEARQEARQTHCDSESTAFSNPSRVGDKKQQPLFTPSFAGTWPMRLQWRLQDSINGKATSWPVPAEQGCACVCFGSIAAYKCTHPKVAQNCLSGLAVHKAHRACLSTVPTSTTQYSQ